jgi:hypothetical protein
MISPWLHPVFRAVVSLVNYRAPLRGELRQIDGDAACSRTSCVDYPITCIQATFDMRHRHELFQMGTRTYTPNIRPDLFSAGEDVCDIIKNIRRRIVASIHSTGTGTLYKTQDLTTQDNHGTRQNMACIMLWSIQVNARTGRQISCGFVINNTRHFVHFMFNNLYLY